MSHIVASMLVAILAQPQAAVAPKDFAVRIVFGCWNDSVDTARKVFTRKILPNDIRTVSLRLSGEQEAELYEIVSAVDLFSYPAEFRPPLTTMTEPAPQYLIEVRSDGRRHRVHWEDYGSSAAGATSLRDMLIAVHGFFTALPAVRGLPPSQIFCL